MCLRDGTRWGDCYAGHGTMGRGGGSWERGVVGLRGGRKLENGVGYLTLEVSHPSRPKRKVGQKKGG